MLRHMAASLAEAAVDRRAGLGTSKAACARWLAVMRRELTQKSARTRFCSMATDDKETLTIRLPKGLKELVDKAAEDRETTVTSIVREALQENLHPASKLYQPPGLSTAFDAFIEKASGKLVVLLVTDGQHRYFCSGLLKSELCNESLVAIHRSHDTPWIIPRCDVVGWYTGKLHQSLSDALARQGWAPRLAA